VAYTALEHRAGHESARRDRRPGRCAPLAGDSPPLRAAVRSLRNASHSCERVRPLAASVRPSNRFASLAEGPTLLTESPAPLARSPAALRRHRGPFITAPSGWTDDPLSAPSAARGSVHEIRARPRSCPRSVHDAVPGGGVMRSACASPLPGPRRGARGGSAAADRRPRVPGAGQRRVRPGDAGTRRSGRRRRRSGDRGGASSGSRWYRSRGVRRRGRGAGAGERRRPGWRGGGARRVAARW
jgi:hypothetical protein